jgi:hypothetical protein
LRVDGSDGLFPRASVLAHRLIHQIIDRAFELGAHAIEDLEKIVAALKGPHCFSVALITH